MPPESSGHPRQGLLRDGLFFEETDGTSGTNPI